MVFYNQQSMLLIILWFIKSNNYTW